MEQNSQPIISGTEFTELRSRALDAAIGAMRRTRALLFTINILASLVLIGVYTERFSFDDRQLAGHLLALEDAFADLKEQGVCLGKHGEHAKLPELQENVWAMVASRVSDHDPSAGVSIKWAIEVGRDIMQVHLINNELAAYRLPPGQPLPIGVQIAHNDMVTVSGVFLVLLYAWYCFSFRQLANIAKKIRLLFLREEETGPQAPNPSDASKKLWREIVDLHFLFRTSSGGIVALFVKALYYSPPIAFGIGFANDAYSVYEIQGTRTAWANYFVSVAGWQLAIEGALLVILVFIAYQVWRADSESRVADSADTGDDPRGAPAS
jgi:hypothetical protein